MKRTSIAVAAFMVVSWSACLAQNLVTNGGFETGDFTGWKQIGDASDSGVCQDADPTVDCSGFAPRSGDWMGSFGAVTSQGGISQTLNTIPGDTYLISFYLSNGEQHPDSYSINFGDVTLALGADVGYMHWNFYQFSEVATSDSTALSFAFYQLWDYYDLDDISVEQVDTPEPASLTLLGSAIGLGMGFLRKLRA